MNEQMNGLKMNGLMMMELEKERIGNSETMCYMNMPDFIIEGDGREAASIDEISGRKRLMHVPVPENGCLAAVFPADRHIRYFARERDGGVKIFAIVSPPDEEEREKSIWERVLDAIFGPEMKAAVIHPLRGTDSVDLGEAGREVVMPEGEPERMKVEEHGRGRRKIFSLTAEYKDGKTVPVMRLSGRLVIRKRKIRVPWCGKGCVIASEDTLRPMNIRSDRLLDGKGYRMNTETRIYSPEKELLMAAEAWGRMSRCQKIAERWIGSKKQVGIVWPDEGMFYARMEWEDR